MSFKWVVAVADLQNSVIQWSLGCAIPRSGCRVEFTQPRALFCGALYNLNQSVFVLSSPGEGGEGGVDYPTYGGGGGGILIDGYGPSGGEDGRGQGYGGGGGGFQSGNPGVIVFELI